MVNDSSPPSPQLSGGLKGYISMNIPCPPDDYRYGVSFYAAIWPLLETPLASFQIGLPSTWIIPDNADFEGRLCPPGTIAGDHWPERGPTYRDVFQTIEGGLGYWASTQFGSAFPKYRMNGTPDCYSQEISSPGWGFGKTDALPEDAMGIAQLNNRLLIPPDGWTFSKNSDGALLGNAWMALPLIDSLPGANAAPTGDQSWTLFLNASNFKGPVAFWIPKTWSRLSMNYPVAAGRGLDARPALMNGGAMEVNTVPYFESADSRGVIYSRIPKLRFHADPHGESMLMQDVTMYSKRAIYDAMKRGMTGIRRISITSDPKSSWTPTCAAEPIQFRQGSKDIPLTGLESVVKTRMFGANSFGLEWSAPDKKGIFPEYFKQEGDKRVVVSADQVPEETHLRSRRFEPASAGPPYASPASGNNAWTHPGPRLKPFHAVLADGSIVTYSWYRFADQPALRHAGLSESERNRLQALVERIHSQWSISKEYLPPPSRGRLATLDPALLVTPPHGLETGYVPIVTRQAFRSTKSEESSH